MTTCPLRRPARSASLADRLDYLAGLATTVGLPTGSSDPFALRLGALAVHRIHPALSDLALLNALTVAARHQPLDVPPAVIDDVTGFLTRRLEQALAEKGRPVEHIRATLVHAERPTRTEVILTQLAALAGTPEFGRLVQTMPRARRIVPRHRPHYDPGVLTEPTEIRLHDTLGKTRAALEGITDLDRDGVAVPAVRFSSSVRRVRRCGGVVEQAGSDLVDGLAVADLVGCGLLGGQQRAVAQAIRHPCSHNAVTTTASPSAPPRQCGTPPRRSPHPQTPSPPGQSRPAHRRRRRTPPHQHS